MTALVAGEPRRFSTPLVESFGQSNAATQEDASLAQVPRSTSSESQAAAYLLAVAFFGFTLAVLALVAVVFWI